MNILWNRIKIMNNEELSEIITDVKGIDNKEYKISSIEEIKLNNQKPNKYKVINNEKEFNG